METLKTFLIAFFGGSAGVAIINALAERWKFRAERKAKKEDRMEEKDDRLDKLTKLVESLTRAQEEMAAQLEALREAQKCVLLDRVIWLGQGYIRAGEIDFDDRRRLREMHNAYHQGLGGNGDADAIMKAVDALPLKKHI